MYRDHAQVNIPNIFLGGAFCLDANFEVLIDTP